MSATTAQRAFDKRLYLKAALDEALEAFDDFAEFSLATEDGRWVLSVAAEADSDYPAEVLASELANFALAQTISRKR